MRPAAELAAFYEDRSTQIIIGASLSIVAVVLFVWFSALLRDRLELELGDRGASLPTAAFGGAILAFTVGLGAETINMAGALRAASDGGISPDAAQAYFDISQILGFNAAGVGLATLIAATAVASLRGSRILPRSLAVPALILAVTLLVPVVVRVTLRSRSCCFRSTASGSTGSRTAPERPWRYGVSVGLLLPESPPSGFSSFSLPVSACFLASFLRCFCQLWARLR